MGWCADGKNCPPDGRLPDASKGAQHIRDIFYRMGFNDQVCTLHPSPITLSWCQEGEARLHHSCMHCAIMQGYYDHTMQPCEATRGTHVSMPGACWPWITGEEISCVTKGHVCMTFMHAEATESPPWNIMSHNTLLVALFFLCHDAKQAPAGPA